MVLAEGDEAFAAISINFSMSICCSTVAALKKRTYDDRGKARILFESFSQSVVSRPAIANLVLS